VRELLTDGGGLCYAVSWRAGASSVSDLPPPQGAACWD